MEPGFIQWLRAALIEFMGANLSDQELCFTRPLGSVDDKPLITWKRGMRRLRIKVAPYLRLKKILVFVVLVDVVS